jgi:hypothetical protein
MLGHGGYRESEDERHGEEERETETTHRCLESERGSRLGRATARSAAEGK